MEKTAGNRIKELREARGLSGTKLAELIGISPQYFYELEKGEKRLNEDILTRIADYFGCSVDYLLGRTDDPRPLRRQIEDAVQDDSELKEFWDAFLSKRELQQLFRTIKDLDAASLRKVIRIIKAIEEEEGSYKLSE